MRFYLKPGDTVQGYTIQAIHHDQGKSIMFGTSTHNGMKYVIVVLTGNSTNLSDWDKAFFPRNLRVADEMYTEQVASRMR